MAFIKPKMTYKEQSTAKFKTYASTVINNHVLDYLRHFVGELFDYYYQIPFDL